MFLNQHLNLNPKKVKTTNTDNTTNKPKRKYKCKKYTIEGKEYTLEELVNHPLNVHNYTKDDIRNKINKCNKKLVLSELLHKKTKEEIKALQIPISLNNYKQKYKIEGRYFTLTALKNHYLNIHELSKDTIYSRIYYNPKITIKELFKPQWGKTPNYIVEGKKYRLNELENHELNVEKLEAGTLYARLKQNPNITLKELFNKLKKNINYKKYLIEDNEYTMCELVNHPLNKHHLTPAQLRQRISRKNLVDIELTLNDLFHSKRVKK